MVLYNLVHLYFFSFIQRIASTIFSLVCYVTQSFLHRGNFDVNNGPQDKNGTNKINLKEPIGFEMMMLFVGVNSFGGKKIILFFSIIFLTYLLIDLLKFQAWALVRYEIKFHIQWVPNFDMFE